MTNYQLPALGPHALRPGARAVRGSWEMKATNDGLQKGDTDCRLNCTDPSCRQPSLAALTVSKTDEQHSV